MKVLILGEKPFSLRKRCGELPVFDLVLIGNIRCYVREENSSVIHCKWHEKQVEMFDILHFKGKILTSTLKVGIAENKYEIIGKGLGSHLITTRVHQIIPKEEPILAPLNAFKEEDINCGQLEFW